MLLRKWVNFTRFCLIILAANFHLIRSDVCSRSSTLRTLVISVTCCLLKCNKYCCLLRSNKYFNGFVFNFPISFIALVCLWQMIYCCMTNQYYLWHRFNEKSFYINYVISFSVVHFIQMCRLSLTNHFRLLFQSVPTSWSVKIYMVFIEVKKIEARDQIVCCILGFRIQGRLCR